MYMEPGKLRLGTVYFFCRSWNKSLLSVITCWVAGHWRTDILTKFTLLQICIKIIKEKKNEKIRRNKERKKERKKEGKKEKWKFKKFKKKRAERVNVSSKMQIFSPQTRAHTVWPSLVCISLYKLFAYRLADKLLWFMHQVTSTQTSYFLFLEQRFM